MKKFKLKKWVSLPVLSLSLASLQALAIDYNTVIQQNSRPTVNQVLDLMETGWKPTSLRAVGEREVPRIAQKPRPDLQGNFPAWFQVFIEDAPRMIACFEKAFPGAKFAFLGRDAAPLADFMEAFYLSLGQSDRVVRFPMSTETVESLQRDPNGIYDFLRIHGFDWKKISEQKHPYVLVDSISRGGGRQGRLLLSSVYSKYAGDHAQLAEYLNFIGLKVATTEIDKGNHRDVCQGYSVLHADAYRAEANANQNFTDSMILTYADSRVQSGQDYLGLNEAGYTHWVYAWHGPFGSITRDPIGNLILPDGGPYEMDFFRTHSEYIRGLVLDYQAHLIKTARSSKVKQAVEKEAQKLGYRFPTQRPYFISRPGVFLKAAVEKAVSVTQILEAVDSFNEVNFGRSSLAKTAPFMTAKTSALLLATQDSTRESDLRGVATLSVLMGEISLQEDFIGKITGAFFYAKPTVDQVNMLSQTLDQKSELFRTFSVETLKYLNSKPSEEARVAFKKLILPVSSGKKAQDEYSKTERDFIKLHKEKKGANGKTSKFTLRGALQGLTKKKGVGTN